MSKRNWAIDEESSDDGSVDDEEEETVTQPQPAKMASSLKDSNASLLSTNSKPVQVDLVCYLANIDPTVDRQTVGKYFEQHQCRIDRLDLKAGDSRGAVAYIGFKDQPSMDNALRLNGNQFEGRKLHVRRMGDSNPNPRDRMSANPKDSRRGDDKKQTRPVRITGREDEPRGTHGGGSGGGVRGSKSENMSNNRQHNAGAGAASTATQPETPSTRPKLQLQQRTLPVEAIGEPSVANAAIFGGGKANDVHVFDVKKKPSDATVDSSKMASMTKSADTPHVTVFDKVKANTVGVPTSHPKSTDAELSTTSAAHGKRLQGNKRGGSEALTGTTSSGGPKFSSYYNKQNLRDSAEAGSADAETDEEDFAVVTKAGRRNTAGHTESRPTSSKGASKTNREISSAGRGSGGRGGHHHEKAHASFATEKTLSGGRGRVVVEVSSAEKGSKPRSGSTGHVDVGQPTATSGSAGGHLFVATAQRANLVGGRGGKDGRQQRGKQGESSGHTGKTSSEKRAKQGNSVSASSGPDAAHKALSGGDNLTDFEKFDRAQKAHQQGNPNVLGSGASTVKQAPKNAFSALEGSDSD